MKKNRKKSTKCLCRTINWWKRWKDCFLMKKLFAQLAMKVLIQKIVNHTCSVVLTSFVLIVWTMWMLFLSVKTMTEIMIKIIHQKFARSAMDQLLPRLKKVAYEPENRDRKNNLYFTKILIHIRMFFYSKLYVNFTSQIFLVSYLPIISNVKINYKMIISSLITNLQDQDRKKSC